jgi:NOL1/NOP2/fmu family ribosome biogenesis protein
LESRDFPEPARRKPAAQPPKPTTAARSQQHRGGRGTAAARPTAPTQDAEPIPTADELKKRAEESLGLFVVEQVRAGRQGLQLGEAVAEEIARLRHQTNAAIAAADKARQAAVERARQEALAAAEEQARLAELQASRRGRRGRGQPTPQPPDRGTVVSVNRPSPAPTPAPIRQGSGRSID